MKKFMLLFGLTLAAGCGVGVPDVPEGETVSYARHLEPLVIAHCHGCHETGNAKAKLVVDEGIGYERLVGPSSVQVPHMALVEPGEPDRSYLWLKLQHRSEEGQGMPRTLTGSKKLRPAELELYRRWIEEGAKP